MLRLAGDVAAEKEAKEKDIAARRKVSVALIKDKPNDRKAR